MQIPSQRHLFDIPEEVAYLNCAYMSPLPNAAAEAGKKGLYAKQNPWRITAPDFFTLPDQARALFAQIVGANSSDIAIVPSVSYATASAVNNLPVGPGQEILVLAEQFPHRFAEAPAEQPTPAPAQSSESPHSQLDELIELLEAEVKDLPTVTCLLVFSLGILMGRFLR